MKQILILAILVVCVFEKAVAQKVVYKVLQDQLSTDLKDWNKLGNGVTSEELAVGDGEIQIRDEGIIKTTLYFNEMEKEYLSPKNYSLKVKTGPRTFFLFAFAKNPQYDEDQLYMYISALNIAEEGEPEEIIYIRTVFTEELMLD